MSLKAPFPYFGGKRKVAELVWQRFGTVRNYVEPFFGSGAVLLGRPLPFDGVETVNDADGLIANAWRALQADPETVAKWADWPVNENDQHARHAWLVGVKDSLQARLEGDPDYFDAKVAGWWLWGMACWIGSGFCSGNGPWQIVNRQLVHVGNAGQGINRQRVHVGDAGQGVKRQLVHVGNAGRGVKRQREKLYEYFKELSNRFRNVRVCCGDWSRVMGRSVTTKHGLTAIFLDPPYHGSTNRASRLYRKDCLKVSDDVREWCLANGDNKKLRIALCGYDGEHVMPGWNEVQGKGGSGYGYGAQSKNGYANKDRERIWFSPHCVPIDAPATAEMMMF